MMPLIKFEPLTSSLPIIFYLPGQFIYQLISFINYILSLINEVEYYLIEIDS